MTASKMLDWIVALLVCWASLTAIFEPRREAAQCDSSYASRVTQATPAIPTQAEFDEMIGI